MKKIRVVLVCALAFWFSLSPLLAQADESQKEEKDTAGGKEEQKNKPLVAQFFKDGARIWTSPFHWQVKDWLWFSAVAAATGVLIANDEGIYQNIKNFQAQNPVVDDVSPFLADMCSGYPFGVAGLFLVHGLIFRDVRSRETGLQALQALIHSFFVVQLTKHLAGRQRPSVDGSDYWHGPYGFFRRYNDGFRHYDAFFSGHTVAIWSLATVVARNYGGAVAWLAYGLAALGGLATITTDLHWASDVFIGAVVGYTIGSLVARRQRSRWQVVPLALKNGAGLSISFGF